MSNSNRYKAPIAIPPGETIQETINDRGWSIEEFTTRMNLDKVIIQSLINGSYRISREIAEKLQNVLEIPASFWLNLEHQYNETLMRLCEEEKQKRNEENE